MVRTQFVVLHKIMWQLKLYDITYIVVIEKRVKKEETILSPFSFSLSIQEKRGMPVVLQKVATFDSSKIYKYPQLNNLWIFIIFSSIVLNLLYMLELKITNTNSSTLFR